MNEFRSDDSRRMLRATVLRRLRREIRAAIPGRADFALVFVLHGKMLRCAAFAHHSPAGERLLRSLIKVYRITRDDADSTVAQVVRLRRPSVRAEIRREQRMVWDRSAGAPEILRLHQQLGVRSVIVVPIEGRRGVLGAVVISYSDSGRHYTRADLGMAERLTREAALIIESDRSGRTPLRLVVPDVRQKRTRIVRVPGVPPSAPRLPAR